ncbi:MULTISPECIES: nucleoside hydrolase [unclassified Bacillus cereus group]|uniref:nucleoside hydrolase n=1 Tax=unclassified Bacillus cereus group TaxID=2750818 RepID=UPI001F5784C7|nr:MULTISPECIES: nucleoside hydrolase [unclassified Bacillus cereus group]
MRTVNKKIIFFGDFGIDDAVSLIYADKTRRLDIIGIVADYGNVSREMVTENVYFLERYYATKIKIIKGASRPMTAEEPLFFPEIHGEHGLGSIIPPKTRGMKRENFCEIIKLIEPCPEDIIIVATGRLTALATLFLLYPEVMDYVHAYYIMGGAFLCPGNVTPVSEANFYGDPIATNIVMKYAKNVSIYPLNVTQRAIITPEMVNFIDDKGTGQAKLIKPMIDFYYENYYKKQYPGIGGSPIHDLLPFIALRKDTIFEYKKSAVWISTTNDETRGQSVADFRKTAEQTRFDNRPVQRIAVNFRYQAFKREFMSTMLKPDCS